MSKVNWANLGGALLQAYGGQLMDNPGAAAGNGESREGDSKKTPAAKVEAAQSSTGTVEKLYPIAGLAAVTLIIVVVAWPTKGK